LRISVIERGNLKAADSVVRKSEIEGQSTILKLVAEGIHVNEGDLLVELDATQLIERKFQQEISVRNAEAAYVKSSQVYEIQQSQNDSDIKKAEQALRFADIDLKKFQQGEKLAQEAEADEAIKLGEEEYSRAKDKVEWSLKLNEKGFLTDTELEADRLALSRAEIQLEQAKRDKDLMIRFQLPRDEEDFISKLDEANRELDRVKLQAKARIVDYESDMLTNEAKLRLERENLQKLETQIAKSKIYAPRAGMVVYAIEEGGRYGSSQPIKEGTQVRERQDIITIPSAAGMIAQVSLHESVLKQVQAGQPAKIKVDAVRGREFDGRVRFVAVMADQNSYWANPNLRLYRTDVSIQDATEDLRPGMSCAIEILVEEIADTLFVPVQSIIRRGSETFAFVVVGNATQQRTVEVGRYNDRWVQILSGLEEGETVLLAPPADFSRESEDERGLDPDAEAIPGTEPGLGGEGAAPLAQLPGLPGGGPGAPAGDGGEAPRGERSGERGERGGGRAGDAARGEEFRKRFEGMSDEERAKAMEAFRGGADSAGAGG
jgi:HlyD family secretion protein